jgi:hypothetical protein
MSKGRKVAISLKAIPKTTFTHKGVRVQEARIQFDQKGNCKLMWRRESMTEEVVMVDGMARPNPLVSCTFNRLPGAAINEDKARKAVIAEFDKKWGLR